MRETLADNLLFIIFTALLLGLIFLLLLAVGHKRNRAFHKASEAEREAMFAREPRVRDIVLLKNGVRVTLTEEIDRGESFLAETVHDYGKRPEALTVSRGDIQKIEYYAS